VPGGSPAGSLPGSLAPGHHPSFNISTNQLCDVFAMPAIGLEAGLGRRLSLAVTATYGWFDGTLWYDNIRVVTADAELRLWTGRRTADTMRRGLHLGVYAAVYRYDFLFGGTGQQAKANWGTGISCGYSVAIGRHFSIDFNLGLGYVSGKSYQISVRAWAAF